MVLGSTYYFPSNSFIEYKVKNLLPIIKDHHAHPQDVGSLVDAYESTLDEENAREEERSVQPREEASRDEEMAGDQGLWDEFEEKEEEDDDDSLEQRREDRRLEKTIKEEEKMGNS